MLKCVVLASGSGSNFKALAEKFPDNIVALICNNTSALALEHAQKHEIPTHILILKKYLENQKSRKDFDEDCAQIVLKYQPDIVILAGWMHILSSSFLRHFKKDQIINLHPSILPENPLDDFVTLNCGTKIPALRGMNCIEKAYSLGLNNFGSTIHTVTEEVDKGKIINQIHFKSQIDEDLASITKRLKLAETKMLLETFSKIRDNFLSHH